MEKEDHQSRERGATRYDDEMAKPSNTESKVDIMYRQLQHKYKDYRLEAIRHHDSKTNNFSSTLNTEQHENDYEE